MPALALVVAVSLTAGPAESVERWWKAYCAPIKLKDAAAKQNARAAWKKVVVEALTPELQVQVLSDGFADPILHAQDDVECAGDRIMKARVKEQTATSAVVTLAVGFPDALADVFEAYLVLQSGAWRTDHTVRLGEPEDSRKAVPQPDDFAKGPEARALGFYRDYLPAAVSFDAYTLPRFESTMARAAWYLSRPLLIGVLLKPHPQHDGYHDDLICFPARSGTAYEVPTGSLSAVSTKTKGNRSRVALKHDMKLNDVTKTVQMSVELVKEKDDAWRIESVSCPP